MQMDCAGVIALYREPSKWRLSSFELFMKLLLISVPIVAIVGSASQRAPLQLPDHLRKIVTSPEVVKSRIEYQNLKIARPSPATFAHIDWSKIKLKGVEADLRGQIADYGLKIRNQGNRGTCSVFALTFCQEYVTANKTGQKNLDFSEEYLNVVGDIAAGSVNDGGFYKDLNAGYQFYGHVNESELPYHDPLAANTAKDGKALLNEGIGTTKYTADFIKNWDKTRGANDAELKSAINYLDQSIPVAVGLLWPAQGKMQKAVLTGVDMMVKVPRSDTVDGHSVVLVGFKKNNSIPGGGYFIFRNSWGEGWGDKGYGYMSFDYVKNYANDLMAYH
jgi:hypothetical protein